MQGLRTAVLVMIRFVEWVCSQQCAGRELLARESQRKCQREREKEREKTKHNTWQYH